MKQIGVRELKTRANEVLRQVREDNESYEITQRGKVIALLTPATLKDGKEVLAELEDWMVKRDRLKMQIAQLGLGPVDAVEIMRGERE